MPTFAAAGACCGSRVVYTYVAIKLTRMHCFLTRFVSHHNELLHHFQQQDQRYRTAWHLVAEAQPARPDVLKALIDAAFMPAPRHVQVEMSGDQPPVLVAVGDDSRTPVLRTTVASTSRTFNKPASPTEHLGRSVPRKRRAAPGTPLRVALFQVCLLDNAAEARCLLIRSSSRSPPSFVGRKLLRSVDWRGYSASHLHRS